VVNAVHEQQSEIDALRAEIAELRALIARIQQEK